MMHFVIVKLLAANNSGLLRFESGTCGSTGNLFFYERRCGMNALDAIKKALDRARTENGDRAHRSSGSACLDLFSLCGGMRRNPAGLEKLFVNRGDNLFHGIKLRVLEVRIPCPAHIVPTRWVFSTCRKSARGWACRWSLGKSGGHCGTSHLPSRALRCSP